VVLVVVAPEAVRVLLAEQVLLILAAVAVADTIADQTLQGLVVPE
jgi:hypothetical protein